MSKSTARTTDAFQRLNPDNIGIGFRPGKLGLHNRLKSNCSQNSKHKMRTRLGMNKPKSK